MRSPGIFLAQGERSAGNAARPSAAAAVTGASASCADTAPAGAAASRIARAGRERAGTRRERDPSPFRSPCGTRAPRAGITPDPSRPFAQPTAAGRYAAPAAPITPTRPDPDAAGKRRPASHLPPPSPAAARHIMLRRAPISVPGGAARSG